MSKKRKQCEAIVKAGGCSTLIHCGECRLRTKECKGKFPHLTDINLGSVKIASEWLSSHPKKRDHPEEPINEWTELDLSKTTLNDLFSNERVFQIASNVEYEDYKQFIYDQVLFRVARGETIFWRDKVHSPDLYDIRVIEEPSQTEIIERYWNIGASWQKVLAYNSGRYQMWSAKTDENHEMYMKLVERQKEYFNGIKSSLIPPEKE